MTDRPALLYFVRLGDDNEELAYSLRSAQRNLPHSAVWIVGHKPAWLAGVEHIPGNRYPDKPRNVFDNLRLAATHPDVPESLVVMNDDFFVMKPWRHEVEYRSTLSQHINSLPDKVGWWAQSLHNTRSWLRQHGTQDPLSYELHVPFPVDKTKLAECLDACADYRPDNPPQWRTIYGNHWQLGGVQAEHDTKVYRQPTASDWRTWPLLSTSDLGYLEPAVHGHIVSRFPKPSRYEHATRTEVA